MFLSRLDEVIGRVRWGAGGELSGLDAPRMVDECGTAAHPDCR